jgi:DNA processing protein
VRRLLNFFECGDQVLAASSSDLLQVEGIGKQLAANIAAWRVRPSWKKDLELVEKYGVTLLPFTDPSYPKALKEISSAPTLLYLLGSLKPEDEQSIAVIGTRNPSIYGKEATLSICKELSCSGLSIVSGLARGIDTAAHRSALEAGGRTLAVIGSGLANLYPPENRELARQIVSSGAILSEYPMITPPDRRHFPQRNRIVSGLTRATLLIEAPEQSGALITMDRAEEQGKKLFALPGRIDQPNFRGNHQLLKSGRAKLVENACEILDALDIKAQKPKIVERKGVLSDAEHSFLDLFPSEEVAIDDILNASSLPITKVNALLMSLMLKKRLREYPGKVYKKVHETGSV